MVKASLQWPANRRADSFWEGSGSHQRLFRVIRENEKWIRTGGLIETELFGRKNGEAGHREISADGGQMVQKLEMADSSRWRRKCDRVGRFVAPFTIKYSG
jgi:hypothetical protein